MTKVLHSLGREGNTRLITFWDCQTQEMLVSYLITYFGPARRERRERDYSAKIFARTRICSCKNWALPFWSRTERWLANGKSSRESVCKVWQLRWTCTPLRPRASSCVRSFEHETDLEHVGRFTEKREEGIVVPPLDPVSMMCVYTIGCSSLNADKTFHWNIVSDAFGWF